MNLSVQVPTMSIEDALSGNYTFIDVRTPAEFQEFHIPNSINIPLFSNEERVTVGTLYKQAGKEQAKDLGVQIMAEKLPSIYAQVKHIVKRSRRPIVMYCWRGGMRSKSVTVTMGTLELPVIQLIGGIRSYRNLTATALQSYTERASQFIVLEGNTGIGKTQILQVLQQEGYPVLDLEEMAGHRGSIFGQIGLQGRSQKMFDSLLYERMQELKDAPYYIIEAESKRIGNIILPEFLLHGKAAGPRIHMYAPLSYRIQTICSMYHFAEHKEPFYEAFQTIAKRLPPDIAACVEDAFLHDDAERIVELLLLHYYDPRYEFAASRYESPVYPVHMNSLEAGITEVKRQIHEIIETKQLSC